MFKLSRFLSIFVTLLMINTGINAALSPQQNAYLTKVRTYFTSRTSDTFSEQDKKLVLKLFQTQPVIAKILAKEFPQINAQLPGQIASTDDEKYACAKFQQERKTGRAKICKYKFFNGKFLAFWTILSAAYLALNSTVSPVATGIVGLRGEKPTGYIADSTVIETSFYKKFVKKNCINISEMLVVAPDHNFQEYVTSSTPFDSENQTFDPFTQPSVTQADYDRLVAVLRPYLKDIQGYNTTDAGSHAGDLYQHTLWYVRYVQQSCSSDIYPTDSRDWCEGLDERTKYLTVVASILHDCGKAGDWMFRYGNDIALNGIRNKDTHPEVGFSYVLGKKDYQFTNGGKLDFDDVFRQLNLSQQEIAYVKTLIGAHHDFGEGLLTKFGRAKSQAEYPRIYDKFLQLLTQRAQKTGYNKGLPSADLIRSLSLMTAADVRSKMPVEGPDSLVSIDSTCCEKKHKGKEGYYKYNMHTTGLKCRAGVLEYFEKSYKKSGLQLIIQNLFTYAIHPLHHKVHVVN